MHDIMGWVACVTAVIGAALATSYTRKYVFWGWCFFFVGNVCWIIYGATTAAAPLIVYSGIRAVFSIRGAYNNTVKRKQAIREQRKKKELELCPNTQSK